MQLHLIGCTLLQEFWRWILTEGSQKKRASAARRVIKGGTGQILIQILDLVEYFDSNGAEVFAMFMGCRELIKLGSAQAIIEEDIFNYSMEIQ